MRQTPIFPHLLLVLLLALVLTGGCAPKQPIRIAISAWAGVEPAELAAQP